MATKKNASPPVAYAAAMDKIRDEMAKSKDKYVEVVGEYLTGYLLAHPEAEAKLLDSGKSIKGSLETVRKEAQKVKVGNMAVLDDQTVFGIVLGYFEIEAGGEATSSDPPQAAAHLPLKGKAFGEAGKAAAPDPFDLDALLASGLAGLSPSDPQDSPGETRDAKRGGALAGVM